MCPHHTMQAMLYMLYKAYLPGDGDVWDFGHDHDRPREASWRGRSYKEGK